MQSLFAVVALATTTVAAAAQSPAVLDTRQGRYEIIGLERWTLSMLQDSLSSHDESLTTHTCAAVIRHVLGFPDVSVVIYSRRSAASPEKFTEIMVVEPQDSSRVRFTTLPEDSLPVRAAWEDVALLLRGNQDLFGFLMNHPQALYAASPPDSLLRRSLDTERLRLIWARGFPTAVIDTAIWTLQHDRNLANEIPALLILGTPRLGSAAQVALGQALRSPFGIQSMAAARLLRYQVTDAGVALPWQDLESTFHAVLDGTNLFALRSVMELLVAAHPDSALGVRLVEGGGRIVLARLAADDRLVRTDAYDFLTALTRYKLPPDPGEWRRALNGVGAP